VLLAVICLLIDNKINIISAYTY